MRKRIITGILIIFSAVGITRAQVTADNNEEAVENLAEAGINDSETDLLIPEIDTPVNINSAESNELEALSLLSRYQVAAIIDYRKSRGSFLSVYELLYIPGFREEDIIKLEPYLSCEIPENNKFSWSELTKDFQVKSVFRYQRVLEKQQGFERPSDSLLNIDPNQSRFLGSPDKMFLRINLKNQYINANIIMEKDAGEELFKGSNRYGFDFYSANMEYKARKGLIRQIILGDYNLTLGQGLLVWTSFSGCRTSDTESIFRKSENFHANRSAEENALLHGFTAILTSKSISASFYASRSLIDASVEENKFTSIILTGSHATPNEITKENSLQRSVLGAVIAYNKNSIHLGVNAIGIQFSLSPLTDGIISSVNMPAGRNVKGISADYRIMKGKTMFSGEFATDGKYCSMLNGCLLYLRPELSIGMMHRHYNLKYNAPLAGAFGENTAIRNEEAFYIGGQIITSQFWAKTYIDIFSFPGLKYNVNLPSAGYRYFLEVGKYFKRCELSGKFERQEKESNAIVDNHLASTDKLVRIKYRFNAKINFGPCCSFTHRSELIRGGFQNDSIHTGYVLTQEVRIHDLTIPIDLSGRLTWFNAEHYEARGYIYERDVNNTGVSQLMYGKGWRYSGLISWKMNKNASIRFKMARSYFPEKESIGTGMNRIPHNHKTEVRIQIIYQFG